MSIEERWNQPADFRRNPHAKRNFGRSFSKRTTPPKMISIKKHIENFSVGSPLQDAYFELIDGLIEVTRDRLPATDPNAKSRFGKDADRCAGKLRSAKSAAEVDTVSAQLKSLLEQQWHYVSGYFFDREKEMAGIISLLADAAAKLDTGNTEFYESLRQTAHQMDTTSRMADVTQLRAKLREQSRFLANEVGRQEARSKSAVAGIRRGIESARREARSIGRFVNTDTLTALPSKLHGEHMLADLLRRKTPVAVAVINVEGLQAVEQRFNEKAAHAVVREFASRLERHLPPAIHLYRWGPASFASFTGDSTHEELRDMLSQFALALAAQPIALKDTSKQAVNVKPVFVTKQERPGADVRTVQATIDGFCAGGSNPG